MVNGIYAERTVAMAPETTLPAPRVIAVEGLSDLYRVLVAEGYRVIGPAVQNGAIVLRELSSAAELPFGWGVRPEPGGYQLRRRDDTAAFGHSAGPQSWKRFLHPPRERLWSAARTPGGGFDLAAEAGEGEPLRYTFLGVRSCDLRAIAIQDRVLAQSGSRHAARRARLLIVAVNCTERDHQEKAFGRGCYGCFGPVANPELAALTVQLRHLGMTREEVDRVFATFNAASPALARGKERPR